MLDGSKSSIEISIHALLAESDRKSSRRCVLSSISIHALLAESDKCRDVNNMPYPMISIHALLAESDANVQHRKNQISQFLSTLSLRRATGKSTTLTRIAWISIHALLAESDSSAPGAGAAAPISIHALLAESDRLYSFYRHHFLIFLSTLSLRRATFCPRRCRTRGGYFYPRSPCGERLGEEYYNAQ